MGINVMNTDNKISSATKVSSAWGKIVVALNVLCEYVNDYLVGHKWRSISGFNHQKQK